MILAYIDTLTQLLSSWKTHREAWASLQAFKRPAHFERRIVFYAETAADRACWEPVVQSGEKRNHSVVRVCSDREDPHRFARDGAWSIDPHFHTTESPLHADIMISEGSGSPMEYAFARLRPVRFIDTPSKINHSEHAWPGLPYLEEDHSEKIGLLLPSNQREQALAIVRDLIEHAREWAQQIRVIREKTVYNVGTSGEAGVEAILNFPSNRGISQEPS